MHDWNWSKSVGKTLKRLTEVTQSNDVISWQRTPEKLVENSQEKLKITKRKWDNFGMSLGY
jgi:phosphoribosylcarboxyaminoimidazole (NCAIR) mutase